jgi:SH3-like domain-containing protein
MRLAGLVWLISLLGVGTWAAEEVAVVKENRVNVRGQPSLVGEVITQLQKGERVVVLEEVTVAKPKTNEPPKWARIHMPTNTPVWVFASFVDPASKTVKVSRLNLRAGPGENYSVVGRLERGAPVIEIRRVDDWMEVETPPGAYAFVAAELLTKGELAALPPPTKPEPVHSTPATAPPPPVAHTEPAPGETTSAPLPPSPAPQHVNPLAAPPQTAASQSPAPAHVPPPFPDTATEAPKVEPKAAAEPKPAPPPPQVQNTAMLLQPAAPAVKTAPVEEPRLRRIVRREGIVRSTVSLQAPTYYELLAPENRKTINFLHTDKLDVDLDKYRGRQIIVTGEEVVDSRWPKTPVIEVETLELIP